MQGRSPQPAFLAEHKIPWVGELVRLIDAGPICPARNVANNGTDYPPPLSAERSFCHRTTSRA